MHECVCIISTCTITLTSSHPVIGELIDGTFPFLWNPSGLNCQATIVYVGFTFIEGEKTEDCPAILAAHQVVKNGLQFRFRPCVPQWHVCEQLDFTFHGVWLYMVPQVTVRTALQLLRVQVSDARAKTTWIGPGRDGDWNAHSDHDCWFCSASFHKLAMISHEHVFTIQARN